MAKLNARGRTVKVEVVREYSADELQRATDKQNARIYQDGQVPDASRIALTTWQRTTRRLMSDGTVLEKRDVRFQPDWLNKDGRRHAYGWKISAKLREGKTADDFARVYSAPRKDGSPSRWTVTTNCGHLPKPVVLSQRRLMAAIESGEDIGFCTNCGAEQYHVEPDANSYRCEGCGQMAVSGAENLLMDTV